MLKVKCDLCGKYTQKRLSHIKKTKNNFCSHVCANTFKNNYIQQKNIQDSIGKKFNHLTVLRKIESKNGGESYVECVCDCGKKYIGRLCPIRKGRVKTCGCRYAIPIKNHFENCVIKKNGKWIWNKYKNKKGYGVFRYKGKIQLAHRVSYELFIGEIHDGMFVCHKNDCPEDVNPENLFLGTQQDNMNDMISKKRAVILRGEKHGNSKITNNDARQIKKMLAEGMRGTDIAKKLGISKHIVSNIKYGKTWNNKFYLL